MPLVSIIVPCYNSRPDLENLLNSIYASKGVSIEVLIVDNASSDGTQDFIKKRYPEVRYIRNKQNKGYAGAINQGIVASSGEYIIACNADIIIKDNKALRKIVDFMEKNREVGVVGTQLVCLNGKTQRSFGFIPGIFSSLIDLFYLTKIYDILDKRKATLTSYLHFDKRSKRYIPGAFMTIRRECLEAVGLWDSSFFFYGEDVDFCFRVIKEGWKIVFLNEINIIHIGGTSSLKKDPRKYKALQAIANIKFIEKYFGRIETRVYMLVRICYCISRLIINLPLLLLLVPLRYIAADLAISPNYRILCVLGELGAYFTLIKEEYLK